MIRQEISLFLKNVPGELGKLAAVLAQAKINIDAMSIQDASSYVTELYEARGKSLKRIASTQSYDSMRRDSDEFALMRLLVDQTDPAIDILIQNGYVFNVMPVIALIIDNQPGELSRIAKKFGVDGINIKYVYGSAVGVGDKALFVFCPENIELAANAFGVGQP